MVIAAANESGEGLVMCRVVGRKACMLVAVGDLRSAIVEYASLLFSMREMLPGA